MVGDSLPGHKNKGFQGEIFWAMKAKRLREFTTLSFFKGGKQRQDGFTENLFLLWQRKKTSYPVDFLQTGGGQRCQCFVVKF